eukprot:CAMPEP_0180820258 /NCGR_PEP_ID=MMETSP1038_2-20121128/70182_1 /TAXON_ID=632150 /ORGANISM="Azadinium spinosum, Strain 3D9" /LENGTH=130 /DNA_ID=CAMNT_0022862323 /DNA_START=33 /DNA_END=422 /DNA_ORIENTATION=-
MKSCASMTPWKSSCLKWSLEEPQSESSVLGVGIPPVLALMVDALLLYVARDVHPIRPEGVPDANSDVVARQVKHVYIEVDFEQRVLVAIDHDARLRLRSCEGERLAQEQYRADAHRHHRHHRARDRGLSE